MKILESVLIKRFKCGYELRSELWSIALGEEPTKMIAAYTPSGDYIGNSKVAYRLVVKRGIQPQKVSKNHCVCSIGYSIKDGKWYGWSHRAIYGFKIGSTCKSGDCHYRPKNKQDFREDCRRFWTEPSHQDVKAAYVKDWKEGDGKAESGVYTSWVYADTVKNEKVRVTVSGAFSVYPEEFGKGAWTAKTTADAKQMAIDFADNVS